MLDAHVEAFILALREQAEEEWAKVEKPYNPGLTDFGVHAANEFSRGMAMALASSAEALEIIFNFTKEKNGD